MFKKFLLIIMPIFLSISPIYAQETINTLLYKGNKKFDQKNFEQASSHYIDAIKKNNNDFGAHYNLGNALYKSKKYEEAKAEYQKAQMLTKDGQEKAASIYNLGNAQMQTGKIDKAIEAYKSALKLDPENEAILKNLQIAKKLQQQKQKGSGKNNQGNNNNQGNQNNTGDSPQDDSTSKPNAKSQENGNQGQENKGQGTQGNQPEPQKNNSQNSQNKELPKELQQLILQRSGNQERETTRNLQNKKAYSVPQSNEKDW